MANIHFNAYENIQQYTALSMQPRMAIVNQCDDMFSKDIQ
jgi:hypothetical protein